MVSSCNMLSEKNCSKQSGSHQTNRHTQTVPFLLGVYVAIFQDLETVTSPVQRKQRHIAPHMRQVVLGTSALPKLLLVKKDQGNIDSRTLQPNLPVWKARIMDRQGHIL